MDQEGFVDLLNEDLELEYQSIVQYTHHIATVKGAEYQSTLDELGVHLRQELDHALTLARQIDFLGGIPSTRVPSIPGQKEAVAALPRADLDLETTQLERYRERVAQAEAIGLPDVAAALGPLLEQTQEHTRGSACGRCSLTVATTHAARSTRRVRLARRGDVAILRKGEPDEVGAGWKGPISGSTDLIAGWPPSSEGVDRRCGAGSSAGGSDYRDGMLGSDLGSALRAAQAAPQSVPDVMRRAAAGVGATDVVVYVVDFAQTVLEPLPDRGAHAEVPQSEPVATSMAAGRSWTERRPSLREASGIGSGSRSSRARTGRACSASPCRMPRMRTGGV